MWPRSLNRNAEAMSNETGRGGAVLERPVSDAMHAGTVTCPPDTPLDEVARTMAEKRIHCVIVRSEDDTAFDGRLWGVVSDLDLVGAARGGLNHQTAGTTAATPVVTVHENESLERSAQLMLEHETTHLVVVDDDDHPVGVLSTLDIARIVGGW